MRRCRLQLMTKFGVLVGIVMLLAVARAEPAPLKPIGGKSLQQRFDREAAKAWKGLDAQRRQSEAQLRRRLENASQRADERRLQQQQRVREKVRETFKRP